MSNTRHIANKPLAWEARPRPFRPDPDPPDPDPPGPPPPPPPPPETFRVEGRMRVRLRINPNLLIVGPVFVRCACHFTIYDSLHVPTADVLVVSANFRDITLYHNCSGTFDGGQLVVGGPTFYNTINTTTGPFYLVPAGGYLMMNHVVFYYASNGGAITNCFLEPTIFSDEVCDAYAPIVLWNNMWMLGSGLYGFDTRGTHYFGASFTYDGTSVITNQYTYRPITAQGQVPIPPTELQQQQFAWFWERPADLILTR